MIDSKNNKYDNVLDEWVNNFCKDVNIDNIICFSYSKEEDSRTETKQKICILILKIIIKIILANQFPKLQIIEVVNDYNVLLPHFNKFLIKILSSF